MKITSIHVLTVAFVMTSFANAQDAPADATADTPSAKTESVAEGAPAEDKDEVEKEDLSGWWVGTWLSNSNGHDGPINGYFTRLDDDNYCVHFNGMFWEIFPFQYNVVLKVTERSDDGVTMSGSSNLGLLFGTFSYTAEVTDTDFSASFRSNLDHGVFSMKRWQPCEEAGEAESDADAGDAEADASEGDSSK